MTVKLESAKYFKKVHWSERVEERDSKFYKLVIFEWVSMWLVLTAFHIVVSRACFKGRLW